MVLPEFSEDARWPEQALLNLFLPSFWFPAWIRSDKVISQPALASSSAVHGAGRAPHLAAQTLSRAAAGAGKCSHNKPLLYWNTHSFDKGTARLLPNSFKLMESVLDITVLLRYIPLYIYDKQINKFTTNINPYGSWFTFLTDKHSALYGSLQHHMSRVNYKPFMFP